MRRRHAALTALAVAPLLAAAACGSGGTAAKSAAGVDFGAKPSGTLNAWAFNSPDDVGTARMKDVAQQLGGVTIKYDQTAFDPQKFTTMLAGGNVPDIVQMQRSQVATYAAQGLIMPLDKCYSTHKVDPTTAYYPSVVQDVTYQNHLWGVPQFYQPPAIMLDMKVLNAAGVTPAEIDTSKPSVLLAAIAKMYKAKGGKPVTLGFDPQATGQDNLWMIGLGGQLVDKSGKPTLTDPANDYPLQLLKQITDAQGGYAKLKSFSDSFDFFGGDNQFVKNQVGAEPNYQWYPNVLSPYQKQLDIAAVPFLDRSGKPVAVADGQAFVIPTKAKNPSAACAYALDVTSQANWMNAAAARAATLSKNGGINTGLFTGSPAADSAIRQQYMKSTGSAQFDQVDNAFLSVVGDGISIGASPAGQEIQTALTSAITEVLLGQQTPQAALAAAQQNALRAYNTASQ